MRPARLRAAVRAPPEPERCRTRTRRDFSGGFSMSAAILPRYRHGSARLRLPRLRKTCRCVIPAPRAAIGMAYASLSQRALASLMITTMLASCSVEGLVPPARIDSETRVGAIGPISEPVSSQSYQAPPAPLSQASGGYADPASAGASVQPMPMQSASGQANSLPMIDSDEAMGQAASAGQPMTVPDDGVDMDAQFGFTDGGEVT